MEKYLVKVNGKEYEVEIEKLESAEAYAAPQKEEEAVKPVRADSMTPKKPYRGEDEGSMLKAGTAGKVYKIVKKAGDRVASGEAVIILEAMKMEIPMVSTCDGTVSEIFVSEGQQVEAGDRLAAVK